MMKKLFCILTALLMLCSAALAEEDSLEAEFYARLEENGAGSWITWSVDELRKYKQVDGLEGALLDEAPADWISREEAYEIAIMTMLNLDEELYPQAWYGVRDPETMTEELARSLSWSAVPAAGTELGKDVWYLWIYDDEWLVPALDCFAFVMDAHTGDVIDLATPGGWG